MSDRKIAIVTGAGRGVGRATAVNLADAGFNLVLVGRTRESLEESASLAIERGAESICTPIDITSDDAASEVVAAAQERFGRVDALINNAGVAEMASIEESGGDIFTRAFELNALAPGRLISAVWPIMKRQSSGRFVNVSTMGVQDPFPGFFAYAASKAPLTLFTQSCANEGAEHNIRAFCVAPGAIETPMLRGLFDEQTFPTHLCLAPEDVAKVIVDCVLGNRDEDNGGIIWLPNPEE